MPVFGMVPVLYKSGEKVDRSKCVEGRDIAIYQPRVNFARLRDEGVAFVWIKGSEATRLKDSRFKTRLDDLKRQVDLACEAHCEQLFVGLYHVAHPDADEDDAKLEADNALQARELALSWGGIDPALMLPCALDTETLTGLKGRNLVDWGTIWYERVERVTAQISAHYTSPAYAEMMGVNQRTGWGLWGGRILWVAHYDYGDLVSPPKSFLTAPTVPKPWENWHFWQPYTKKSPAVTLDDGKTQVPCDLNYFNGTLDSLRDLIRLSHKDSEFWNSLGLATEWTPNIDWKSVVMGGES